MKALYYLAVIAFFFGSLVLVILCNLPYSGLSVEGNVQNYVQSIVPQGWQFFTLDPRSEYTIVYKIEEDKSLNFVEFQNSSLQTGFGISRLNRIKNIELAAIMSLADTSEYIMCKDYNSFKKVCDTMKAKLVINNTNIQKLKGLYIVRKTTPIPWAWYANNPNLFMPSKIVKLDVQSLL